MNATPIEPWPFDQPRNCATATMRQVIEGTEPILLVTHDEHDHGWQFLGSSPASMADLKLVSLESMVRRDPSVLEVADLPPGWWAFRERAGGAWKREPRPPDPDDET